VQAVAGQRLGGYPAPWLGCGQASLSGRYEFCADFAVGKVGGLKGNYYLVVQTDRASCYIPSTSTDQKLTILHGTADDCLNAVIAAHNRWLDERDLLHQPMVILRRLIERAKQ
jgi:hypothetical protein